MRHIRVCGFYSCVWVCGESEEGRTESTLPHTGHVYECLQKRERERKRERMLSLFARAADDSCEHLVDGRH